MKILVISGILPLPGVERSNDFLIELYSSYKSKYPSDEVTFIRPTATKMLSKWKKVNKEDEFTLAGFRINLFPYFSTWRFPVIHTYVASGTLILFNKRKIRKYVEEFKPDIVQAEYIVPDGFMAFFIYRKFGVPFLITTHNEYRYFDASASRFRILKMLHKACFVTPLNYVSEETMKRYKIKQCLIIPLGVDERFLKINRSVTNSDRIRVLSVGLLDPLKNFDKVLYALSSLKQSFDFTYTVIGEGPEMANLVSLTGKLGLNDRVTFKGRVNYDLIPEEMGKHDIFIMPSYFESFGRVFFEAMATGLPVICAKNTGIHGYFTEGEEGFSVNHDNIKEITNKLALLFENPELRINMGNKARKFVEKYTWENIVTEFNNLYTKSLNCHPR